MTNVPNSAAQTVAMTKLQALLRTGKASAIARTVGSTPNTLRNVAHGFSRPKAETVERYVQLGIEPADWFTVADSGDDDILGLPATTTGS